MQTVIKNLRILATAMLLSWIGCAMPVTDSARQDAPENDGRIELELMNAPSDAACLQITVKGATTAVRSIALSPGMSTTTLPLSGLPVGQVQFSAEAFAIACTSVGPESAASWVSDAVMITLVSGQTTNVALVLHRASNANVSVDFADTSCSDTLRNGAETDVDCGGPSCPKCANGKACIAPSDCSSANCVAGVCQATTASCSDTLRNGAETDVDCGGPSCPKCANGKACIAPSDCSSANCVAGVCQATTASCSDTLRNGAETDVDCGGPSCPKCANGKACIAPSDCSSANCVAGVCQATTASCSDTLRNGAETDVDCGGPSCPKCANGKACIAPSDCSSANCVAGVCQATTASCSDTLRNGAETDVDCGGPSCPKCANGKACIAPSDCSSANCVAGVCQATTASCSDTLRNGAETDVDCGGPSCPKCANGKACIAPSDCSSGACQAGVCATGFIYNFMEAESGTLPAPWQMVVDSTASGGKYIQVTPGTNSSTAPPTGGRASYAFTVATTATYKVWGRVIAPTNSDDSFWVSMDGGAWVKWNDIFLRAGGTTWRWDDVHDTDAGNVEVTYNLAAGTHTLQIAYREDGTKLDRILVTNDAGFVPSP